MENRKLFQKVEILCECCGKNLLEKDSMGIFVTWLANQKSSNGKDVYQKAYYCCKGKCDDILKKKSLSEGLNVSIRPRACFFPLFSFLPLWLHYNLNPLCVQY